MSPGDNAPQLPIASARRTLAVLGRQLRAVPIVAVSALLTVFAASLAGLVAPWVLGQLVDDINTGAVAADVWRTVALIAGAALLAGLFTGLGAWLVARTGETVLARLRERVLDRVLHLPASTLEKTRIGDLLARVGDDVAVVTSAITTTGPELVTALFTVALTGAGLFALDWRLGLAGLVALPMYLLALRWYLPKSAPFYAAERVAMGERSHAMIGALQGHQTVRAYRLEDIHNAEIDLRSRNAMDLALGVFRLFGRFMGRLNRAEFIGLSVVLVVGFFLVRADLSTIGATTAAALYFHRLFNPLSALVTQFNDIQSAGASLARLAGVVEMPVPPPPAHQSQPQDSALELRDITHRYQDGPPVLHEVALRVAPGERVALVGASGAGKTTLAAIGAGVLTQSVGQVRLGGVDLSALSEDRLRAAVMLLSQEVHVFAGTLEQDIRLAKSNASREEILAALDTVGAAGWVRGLPDGIATEVGEGGHQLTAAQAQQLALARLVLADPAVAVLDEATAEAGSAGARELERAVTAATKGRTTLIVAHRLTQAQTADRVVVMDKGHVIETGTHDELVAADGQYATLWRGWTGQQRAAEP